MISLPPPLPPLGGTVREQIQDAQYLRNAWEILRAHRLYHLLEASDFTALSDGNRTELQRQVEALRTQDILRHAVRSQDLQKLISALHTADIFPIVLKGAALSTPLYPTPASRPSVDVDLLVPLEAVDALHRLMHTLGWISDAGVRGEWVSHQFSYRSPRSAALSTRVDIHWRLTNRPQLHHALGYDELFARATPPEERFPFAHCIALPDALIHAIVHLIAHHHGEENPAIWYLDIAALDARLSSAERIQVLAKLRDRGLLDLAAIAWQDAARLIGFTPSAESRFLGTHKVPKSLQWSLAPVSRPQEIVADLRALPTRSKLRYLRELLLPNEQNLRAAYGPADRHTPLWRLYVRRFQERGIRPRAPKA